MPIEMERFLWIDESTHFRVRGSVSPFCRVIEVDGRWEIVFRRGPTNAGPHYAGSFSQARRWVLGYAKYHEAKLTGARIERDNSFTPPSWLDIAVDPTTPEKVPVSSRRRRRR
jgi:hypothetical protein